jgi:MFS family permease
MLAGLTFSLSMGENLGWTNPAILGGFLAALLLFPAFLVIESRSAHPFLKLRIFKDATYSLFVGGRVMATLFQSGNLFLLPFFLVCLLKLSQAQAGLVMLSYTVLYTCLAPFSGLLADRFRPERVGFAALLLLFGGCLFFLSMADTPAIPWVVAFLLLVSTGFAIFFPSNNKLSILFVPPENRGMATGLMLTVWAVGQSLGVSLFELVFSTRLGALSPDTLSGKWSFDRMPPDVLITSFKSAYFSGTLTILLSIVLTGIALLRMNRGRRA